MTPRAGKVALVGRPNVGKSTLLNALLGERIAITSPHPQTTRDRILGVLTEPGAQFVFLDTPGIHAARSKLGARMNREAREAAREADVLVLVTDVVPGAAPVARDVDMTLVKSLPEGIPVVLALNKIDRVKDKTELLGLLEAHARAFDFAALVPVSGKVSSGMESLKRALREHLPELPKGTPLPFDEDTLTDRPVRYLVAELVREQVLHHTRQEVPHGVAVIVDSFDEAPKVPRILLSVHVDRESHKRIVIGKQGTLLKRIGIEARKRVEELVGKKVHLEIWVRVTPGWYESAAGLREMGYGETEK